MSKGLPFHEIASIFPLMTGASFDAMVADIEEHGLREPIVKHKGKVVDGRNRQNACLKAKREPFYVEWDEKGSLASYVVSANLHRRHLDESQRAMVAAEIANLEHGQKKSDAQICASGEPVTQAEAAELVNVSRRAVQQATKVVNDAAPEVVEAVKSGDVSVSAAATIASLPKSKQADALLKEKLHKDVVAAWESGELKRSQCKKLSELRAMLQVDELNKLRAAGKTKESVSDATEDGTPEKEAKSEPLIDGLKKPVPEKLRGAFERVKEVAELVRELQGIKSKVESLNEVIGFHIHFQSFAADIDNAKRALKFATPYTVCGYCKASERKQSSCKACNGCGWLPRNKFHAQPAENKE